MEPNKDELLTESFTNSLSAIASIFALREILLQTDEQKDLFISKRKEYMEKLILDFVHDFKIDNPNKFLEGLVKSNNE